MRGPLQITSRVVVPESELSWRFSRSSGPGGQSVNTTDSRAEVLFDVAGSPSLDEFQRARAVERLGGRLVDGVLSVVAQDERSQLQNRELAASRLAQLLREALAPPPPPRRATKPTRGSKERRLAGKKLRSAVKKGRRAQE